MNTCMCLCVCVCVCVSMCVYVCVCVCVCTMSVKNLLGLHVNLSLQACDHHHMIGRVSIGWILLNLFIQSLSEGNCLFYRNCVSAIFKRLLSTEEHISMKFLTKYENC